MMFLQLSWLAKHKGLLKENVSCWKYVKESYKTQTTEHWIYLRDAWKTRVGGPDETIRSSTSGGITGCETTHVCGEWGTCVRCSDVEAGGCCCGECRGAVWTCEWSSGWIDVVRRGGMGGGDFVVSTAPGNLGMASTFPLLEGCIEGETTSFESPKPESRWVSFCSSCLNVFNLALNLVLVADWIFPLVLSGVLEEAPIVLLCQYLFTCRSSAEDVETQMNQRILTNSLIAAHRHHVSKRIWKEQDPISIFCLYGHGLSIVSRGSGEYFALQYCGVENKANLRSKQVVLLMFGSSDQSVRRSLEWSVPVTSQSPTQSTHAPFVTQMMTILWICLTSLCLAVVWEILMMMPPANNKLATRVRKVSLLDEVPLRQVPRGSAVQAVWARCPRGPPWMLPHCLSCSESSSDAMFAE